MAASREPLQTPVLICGGGTGGVAAALALARLGVPCVMTEPTDWIGGQLTSQAVPPDENRWIEGREGIQSATTTYLNFRQRVRAAYRQTYPLTPAAQRDPHLNPGQGWVSHLCFPPALGHAVLRDMLQPAIDAGTVRLLLHHAPVSIETAGASDAISAVVFHDLSHGPEHGAEQRVEARYVLDATELGDLYPIAGIAHHLGGEHRDVFGELHGRTDHSEPTDQQAITWCFAMEHRPDEDHRIDRPAGYDTWRDFVPDVTPPWCGPLFSWDVPTHDAAGQRTLAMTPWPDEPNGQGAAAWELWRYRRIVARALFDPAAASPARPLPPDVSLFNCVQMDYFGAPLLGVSVAEQQAALAAARDQSLCFFYWMQTDAPRHDGGTGYPGLKLRGEELGTATGFAKAAYIREPRRLDALQMFTEAHVGAAQRRAEGKPDPDTSAYAGSPMPGEAFVDSIAIGHYYLDLHPSCAGRNNLYVESCPYRIPLGALIPKPSTTAPTANLIAAGKAIGVSHIANGCTRLHPVEWAIGEAAAHVAAYALANDQPPEAIYASADAVHGLQNQIVNDGAPITWPWET